MVKKAKVERVGIHICKYCDKKIHSGGIRRVRSYHGGRPIITRYHKGCARPGFGYVGTHGKRGQTITVRW